MKRHRFPLVLMLAALVLSFIGCQAPETQVTGTVNVTVDIQGYDGYDKVVIWGTDSSGNAGPGSITLESSEKSGTLTLPAGTWTIQASVMKGGVELASGKTSVKVIPDTTVSASITIKKNEGGGGGEDPDKPSFNITAERNELITRDAVEVKAAVPEGVEKVDWYINGELKGRYKGKSVMILGFDLKFGDNTIKASYAKADGSKVESNELILKLKESLDMSIEYKLNSEGKPAVTFGAVYCMTDASKAELLAKNPDYEWKVGVGDIPTAYNKVIKTGNVNSAEYVLEKTSAPMVGGNIQALDSEGNLLYYGYNAMMSLFDSVIKLPETIKQGEEFTAEFSSNVLEPNEKWTFKWYLDDKPVENGTGKSVVLTVNDVKKHNISLDIEYDGCIFPSLKTEFIAVGEVVTPDPLAPYGNANISSPLPLYADLEINLYDMNPRYDYYLRIGERKINLPYEFNVISCTEFGYGTHEFVLGVTIDGADHETEAHAFEVTEGVSFKLECRTPDNINTAVAKVAMKDDNIHKNSNLIYKWKLGNSTKIFETDVPEIEIPTDLGFESVFIDIEVDVYDGTEKIFSRADEKFFYWYVDEHDTFIKVPSKGTITHTLVLGSPYFNADIYDYEWLVPTGLKFTVDKNTLSLELSAADVGVKEIYSKIIHKTKDEYMYTWFDYHIEVDDTAFQSAGFDFTVKGLDEASYYKFALDEETPVQLEKLTISRDVDPDTIHKAKIEAFDAHDRLIGSWSAENLEVKVGKRLAVDAVVTPLDVFGKVTLNITNSIDPIDGDPWLTPVSYKIHVKSVNDDFENTVTDISKPVVVDKLYENEAYIITVSAINSSDAIIGESTTVSAQAGEAEKNVNVEELKTNGTLDVSVGGVGSAATVSVSYGSINVPMKFTDGAWTGSLETVPGKGNVTVSVNGIEKTIATRIVSGHPSKVSVSYTGVDLTITNEIVTTPEIKITVVKDFDTATRQIVLKAEVAGYPNAAFTWQTTYETSFEGSEITWTVPDWPRTSYYNINVITNCGGRNTTKSYKLEIPTV